MASFYLNNTEISPLGFAFFLEDFHNVYSKPDGKDHRTSKVSCLRHAPHNWERRL